MTTFEKYLEEADKGLYKTLLTRKFDYKYFIKKAHPYLVGDINELKKLKTSFGGILILTSYIDVDFLSNFLEPIVHTEYGEGTCHTFLMDNIAFDIDHRGTSISIHDNITNDEFMDIIINMMKKHKNNFS